MFAIALIPNLRQGETLYWEAANALGFVSFAGLLILLANGYRKSGHSHFHRWFGITVFFAMLLHALWFLIKDNAVLEYILPGAPIYMVLGIAAVLFSILFTVSSLQGPRKAAYNSGRAFRYWHKGQSIVIVILSGFHIALSGFYFVFVWQWVGLVMLTIFSVVLPAKLTPIRRVERAESLKEIGLLILACVLCIAIFVILRWQR